MNHAIEPAPPVSARLPLPRRRHKALAVLAALLILMGGGVIGSGLTVLHFRSRVVRPADSPEAVCHMITSRLSSSVPIEREELEQIRVVVQGNIGRVDRLREEYGDEVREQLLEMCDRICEILGPERSSACAHLLLQGEKSDHEGLF